MRTKFIVLLALLAICSNAFAGEIIPFPVKWKKFSIPRVLIGRIILSDATSRATAISKIQAAYQQWDFASNGGILAHTYEDRGETGFTVIDDGENTFNFLSDDAITFAAKSWNWGISGAGWRTSDVDIRFNNDGCFDFGVCPYTPQGPLQYLYDFDTVLFHEAGHEHGWDHCMSTVRYPGNCSWDTSVMTGHVAPPPCYHITMGPVDTGRALEMYNENPYDPTEPGNDTFDGTPVNLGVINPDEYLNFVEDYNLQGTNDTDCYRWSATESSVYYDYLVTVSGMSPYTFMAVQVWYNNQDLGTRIASSDQGYAQFSFDARSGNYEMRIWNFNGEGMGREYGLLIWGNPLVCAVPQPASRDRKPPEIQILAGKVVVPSLPREGILGIYNAGGQLLQTVDIPEGKVMAYTPQRLASGVYFAALNNNSASPAKLVIVR